MADILKSNADIHATDFKIQYIIYMYQATPITNLTHSAMTSNALT